MTFDPHEIRVDDEMPTLEFPPINRATLALFAGASGDHNPIHIDIDHARQAGMKDVFAHGMLSMAYLGRTLTQWVPQHRVLRYGVRFSAMTYLGDSVRCKAKVVELLVHKGRPCARVALSASRNGGEVTLTGDALVALD